MSNLNFFREVVNRLTGKASPPKNSEVDLNYTFAQSTMGKFCRIGSDSYVFNTNIGDFTYLGQRVTIMNCSVGKFCSIAQGVSICLGKHPSTTFVSTHPAFFSLSKQNGMTFSDKDYFEEMGKAKIGHDVWIGLNAIIMDNITVGNGAIIGAGAIVTKDVPPFAIVAGNPAMVLRYRFEKDEIDFLQKFKWWDKDYDWLKENFKDMQDIKLFEKKHAIGTN